MTYRFIAIRLNVTASQTAVDNKKRPLSRVNLLHACSGQGWGVGEMNNHQSNWTLCCKALDRLIKCHGLAQMSCFSAARLDKKPMQEPNTTDKQSGFKVGVKVSLTSYRYCLPCGLKAEDMRTIFFLTGIPYWPLPTLFSLLASRHLIRHLIISPKQRSHLDRTAVLMECILACNKYECCSVQGLANTWRRWAAK